MIDAFRALLSLLLVALAALPHLRSKPIDVTHRQTSIAFTLISVLAILLFY